MKTLIEKLNEQKEELYNQTRNVLVEVIDEYQTLTKCHNYVSVNVKQQSGRTIVAIDYSWNEENEDYNFSYRFSGNGEHQKFSIDDMFEMIEQINKKSEPYRKLKKYREQKEVETIVILFDNYQAQKQITLKADNLEELFITFYKMNKAYRYCNGTHYAWNNSNFNSQYQQWLDDMPKEMSMDLYYGNGIVD